MTRKMMLLITVSLLVAAWPGWAEEVRWIPAAASNPGVNGTQWTTDLWVYSRVFDAPLEVHVAFLPEVTGTTEPEEVTVEVPASRAIMISDVVGTLFHQSRPGALRLRADFQFEARSRTYNNGGDRGTFGQGIAAISAESETTGWILLGAANQLGESGVRSNLGLYNTGDRSDEVGIMVVNEDTGGFLSEGIVEVEIGPYGWFQTDVFELVGAGDVAVDNAVVLVLATRDVRCYLSVVDNLSGDGTFILPGDAESVYALTGEWEVVTTLITGGDVTINSLVYTGEDGSDVSVDGATNGWTVTEHFTAPARFCYQVDATAGSAGGSIEVDVKRTRNGGSPSLSRSGRESFGPAHMALGKCYDLY